MRLERLAFERLDSERQLREAARRLRALVPGADDVAEAVREIVALVRDGGEAALLECVRRYDTAGAEPRPLLVPQEELDEALAQLPLDVVAGLQVTIANVAAVADHATSHADIPVNLPQGHTVTLRELPVERAAVYAPGGRAAYPSTVAMGVVTARAAGVVDVVVCTPPGPDGQAHMAALAACRLCGVQRVYRMGGAHAIAALAHGTESVEPVDVVVGPGNLYVQEAKRQLSAVVGIDGFAGPSDLMVAFGAEYGHVRHGESPEGAGPEGAGHAATAADHDAGHDAEAGDDDALVRLVALDVLAQAEHGTGSLVVAVSSSPRALDALQAAIEAELGGGARVGESVCVLVGVPTVEHAVALANAFAPEHLQLVGAAEEALARRVSSAGCLFVGPNAPTAFGDYVAGSNHVLPTGGAARFSSSLGPRHFRRTMPVVSATPAAASKLARAGAPIAAQEGFPLHAKSMLARAGEPAHPPDGAEDPPGQATTREQIGDNPGDE